MCSPAILLACLAVGSAAFAQDFALRDGDTVVFYGDSITDQRLYTTFVETFTVTRFPSRDIRFVHSGWGGDRVSGGGGGPIDVRLKRDVFAYRPTVLTVMLGMNDGSYRAFDSEIFDRYSNGYRSLIRAVKSALPETRITVIEPSPYDDVTRPPQFNGGYNAVLKRYGQFLRELARDENLSVADLNASVVKALEKANSLDTALAQRIIPDRVHPGAGGHLLMAAALLRAWNAPATVSDVEIEAAATPRVVTAYNTELQLANPQSPAVLAWTQTDRALPLPLDPKDTALQLSVRASDIVETLNRQTLRVTGLAPGNGRWSLRIDGEEAGAWTSSELAAGVNLATLNTPMSRQAAQVHALTLKRTSIHNTRWRTLEVPLADDKLKTYRIGLAALDAMDDELRDLQRAAAKPLARRYELTPVQ